jgi:hypothetical protein
MMGTIQLYRENPDTLEREIIGTLSENQLDFLIDNIEEDLDEDEEYLLNLDTISYLKEQGADSNLIAMLEKALAGNQDGIEIVYLIE